MPELSKQPAAESGSVDERYPNLASWVQDGGFVEIGRDDFSRSFVRALDVGGMIWEGEAEYRSLDEALQALDDGIGAWQRLTGAPFAEPGISPDARDGMR